jgi:hypothetical protein
MPFSIPSPIVPEGLDPVTAQQLQKMQEFLQHPWAQKLLRITTDPAIQNAFLDLAKSPDRMKLLYFQLGWFVFFVVLRSWRLSKGAKWYGRLWTRLWTLVLYMAGASFLLPGLILGAPFWKVLDLVVKQLN